MDLTSYISAAGSGDRTGDELGSSFGYTTTSWFILDAVEVRAPRRAPVIVAFGDSITDGTFSTNNANDRWVDLLALRLHAAYGGDISVVNAALTGNALTRDMGGPAGLSRLDRDVLGAAGVSTVILLEGINDLGAQNVSPDELMAAYQQVVNRLHAAGVRVITGTLTPALVPAQDYSTNTLGSVYGPAYGAPATELARQQVNAFIRTSGIFDGVVDFEAAVIDPATGSMRAEYAPSSMGGPGDYLHPNHGGLMAMANAVDLSLLMPRR
jgi:lysophospholipase L1-like esterase